MPRVPVPSVGITLAGGCQIHPCEDVTPRSSLIRTHSPIPFGSSCLRPWPRTRSLRRLLPAVPRQNYDRLSNQVHKPGIRFGSFTCKTGLMLRPLRLILVLYSRFFHSRRDLLLENLALRQQLGVLQRRRPQPRLVFLTNSSG